MTKKTQLYFEDLKEGDEIPTLTKISTTVMAVRWAGASGDFNPHHYDDTYANEVAGTQKIITHGALKRAWLVQLMTDWTGDKGFLKKFACQYRGMDFPRRMKSFTEPMDGDTWWCKGIIKKKYIEDDKHCVDCEIWVENNKGEKTTPGSATVILPSKT